VSWSLSVKRKKAGPREYWESIVFAPRIWVSILVPLRYLVTTPLVRSKTKPRRYQVSGSISPAFIINPNGVVGIDKHNGIIGVRGIGAKESAEDAITIAGPHQVHNDGVFVDIRSSA